jgi:hypothetical protein
MIRKSGSGFLDKIMLETQHRDRASGSLDRIMI